MNYYFFENRLNFEKITARISDYQSGNFLKRIPSFLEEEKQQVIVSPRNRQQIDSPNASFSKQFSHQISINKQRQNVNSGVASIFPESFKLQIKSFALVIEGDVISSIFSKPKHVQEFIKIISVCR